MTAHKSRSHLFLLQALVCMVAALSCRQSRDYSLASSALKGGSVPTAYGEAGVFMLATLGDGEEMRPLVMIIDLLPGDRDKRPSVELSDETVAKSYCVISAGSSRKRVPLGVVAWVHGEADKPDIDIIAEQWNHRLWKDRDALDQFVRRTVDKCMQKVRPTNGNASATTPAR